MDKAVESMSVQECQAEWSKIQGDQKHPYWGVREGVPWQIRRAAVQRVGELMERLHPNEKPAVEPGISVGLINAGVPPQEVQGKIEAWQQNIKDSIEKGEKANE